MSYDFVTRLNRRDSGSTKWNLMLEKNPDAASGIVPLSVADMEFKNPPEIISALQRYLDDAVLGYTDPTDEFLEACAQWQRRRHGWQAEKRFVVVTPGVVPALYGAVRALTKPGEGVIIQTPVYGPFRTAVEDAGRTVVANPLKMVEEPAEDQPSIEPGQPGATVRHRYEMDFDDLAKKASDPDNTLLLLCNPHNPVGRAWSAADLRRLLDICVENGVAVVSDEIHGDLVMPGHAHVSIMQVADVGEYPNVMVCTAPSKTFNLAGCQSSVAFVPSDAMRDTLREELGRSAIWQLNALAYPATISAYTECDAWLEELIEVVAGNYAFLRGFMERYLPEVEVYPLEATYLAWLDFRAWGLTPQELEDFMTKEALLFFDEGYAFGEEGEGFERMNLACPRSVIEESLERLVAAARDRRLGTLGGRA